MGFVSEQKMPREIDLDEKDTIVLRAFLQRGEVRLSTMNRVGGAFLGGAGLLTLFPILFREAFKVFADLLMQPETLIANSEKIGISFCLLIVISLPLVALYFLLRDIVGFYIVPRIPGYDARLFHPKFALTALAVPLDEVAKSTKDRIRRIQSEVDYSQLLLSGNDETHNLYCLYGQRIAPPTRREGWDSEPDSYNDEKRLDLALGLAGWVELTLCEEVSRMELSLARHAIILRRLLMRYMKALILCLLTSMVGVAMGSFTSASLAHSPIWIFSMFAIWSVCAPIIWLKTTAQTTTEDVDDGELKKFEEIVYVGSSLCLGFCLIKIALLLLR